MVVGRAERTLLGSRHRPTHETASRSYVPMPPRSSSGEAWQPSLQESRYSHSLERGLAILTCFSAERSTLGIADIADMLGMSRSTIHRYVITLVALGYMEQCADRKYRLGLRVTDLGIAALNSVGLRDHAREPLEELRRRSSYTVNLAILDGPRILYLERKRSYRREQPLIDLGLHLGSRLPAYCTAMGKTLLANLAEGDLDEAIRTTTLKRRGPRTIVRKKQLRAELGRIQMDAGFAINDQELADGLHSISAPVRGEKGVVAAVNMAAHTSMVSLPFLVDTLGPQLVETAGVISTRLSEAHKAKQASGRGYG